MIVVTGDVHDMEMGGLDQKFLKSKNMTELDCAVKYSEIAAQYAVPVTLYLTGKSVKNETDKCRTLSRNTFVDLGGHTYNALQPNLLHLLFKSLFGSYYGPFFYQKSDILKTITTFRSELDINIKVWRTHAYKSDLKTYEILGKYTEIESISDEVGPSKQMKNISGLISVPINTIPDHEHLYHGAFTREYIENDQKRREKLFLEFNISSSTRLLKEITKKVLRVKTPLRPFGEKHYEPVEWFNVLKKQIDENERRNEVSTVLLHPACMEILDEMALLKEVFQFLRQYKCVFMKDVKR